MNITIDEQTVVVIIIMLIFIYKENFILIFHNIIHGLYISLCDINRFNIYNVNHPFTQKYMNITNGMNIFPVSSSSLFSSSNNMNTYDYLEYNNDDGRFYLYNSKLPRNQGNPIIFNFRVDHFYIIIS